MAKKNYTAMPALPPALAARYEAIVSVLSGQLTVSEAARRLGLSRNHFQSLMRRALGSLLEELGPNPPERPRTPERERLLEEEADRLRREIEQLKNRVESTDHILNLASSLLQGRTERAASRERGARKPATEDE